MAACPTCKNLDHAVIRLFFEDPSSSAEGWDRSFQALRRSSISGCRTCATIDHAMCTLNADWNSELDETATPMFLDIDQSPERIASIRIHKTFEDGEIDEGTEYEMYPRGALPTTCGNTGSAAAVEITKTWLHGCLKSHKACWSPEKDVLPPRLIDIDPYKRGMNPRLIEIYDSLGPTQFLPVLQMRSLKYVCLSHCWGKNSVPRTTSNNIETHKESIPWSSLTLTFQETIAFVSNMGERYLWIDSLCIIQDSPEDWANHVRLMAPIYANGLLTISATASEDGTQGLFRQTENHAPIEIDTSDCISRDVARITSVRKALDHPDQLSGTSSANLPLVGRAWCYQEYLLSPRVLQFTSELVWECWSSLACECSRIDATQNDEKAKLAACFAQEDRYALHKLWRDVVRSYTTRSLSFGTDKLPALAGVAREIMDRLTRLGGDTYLAGLWQGALLEDLTWWTLDFRAPVSEYRAPSWSWAAIDGPVRYGLPMREYEARVLEAVCVSKSEDVFSTIERGHIVLEGPLILAKVFADEDSYLYSITTNLEQEKFSDELPRVFHDYQFSENEVWKGPEDGRLYCLKLGSTDLKAPGESYKALLLTKLSNGNYRRIGVFESDVISSGASWFDNAPIERVRVV